jgi:AcrR family transcriptional regulator
MERNRRDAEATREALLDGAEQLFAERGFDGTSLQALSDLTGVNKAMVSYYFGGKEGLYRAVLRRVLAAFRQPLRELREGTGSACVRLRALVEIIARISAQRPSLPRILLREHLAGGARITDEVFDDLGQALRTTEHLLAEGRATGEFVEVDAHSLHLSLVGGLAYFLVSLSFREGAEARLSSPSVDAFVRHTQDLFVRALRPSDRDTEATKIGDLR